MAIWIDERSLKDHLNVRPSRIEGFLSGPLLQRQLVGVPGTTRQLVGGQRAPDARVGTIEARVPLTALPDRPATLRTLELALTGERWLRTIDRPGVRTRCHVTMAPREIPQARGLTIPTVLITLTCVALDGSSEHTPARSPVLCSTTPAAVPTGSLPTTGWLMAWGYTSPLTITYRTGRGDATTLVITQALATGEHCALDLLTEDVWHVAASGTRAKVASVAGTFPACDPRDAVGSLAPTLALSSGSGLLLPTLHDRI